MVKTHRKRYRMSAGERKIHLYVSKRRTHAGWGVIPGLSEGCRKIFSGFETEHVRARRARNHFRELGGNPFKGDRRGYRIAEHDGQA